MSPKYDVNKTFYFATQVRGKFSLSHDKFELYVSPHFVIRQKYFVSRHEYELFLTRIVK